MPSFGEPVVFELPVYPHTLRFVRAKLTDEQGQPRAFVVSPYSQGLSLFVWLTAQSPQLPLISTHRWPVSSAARHINRHGHVLTQPVMSSRLGLGIHEFHISRHQWLLNQVELEQLANYVDVLIEEELIAYCLAAPDQPARQRIRAFVDRYDFDDYRINEDRLRLVYRRYCQRVAAFPLLAQRSVVNHFAAGPSPSLV